jgi:hypothetical protein
MIHYIECAAKNVQHIQFSLDGFFGYFVFVHDFHGPYTRVLINSAMNNPTTSFAETVQKKEILGDGGGTECIWRGYMFSIV